MKNIANLIGSIDKVGERTCEECGSTVPIYQRTDSEGNVHKHSICLRCDNNILIANLPSKEDVPKKRLESWVKNHEHVDESIKHASFATFKPTTDSQHDAKRLSMGYAKKFGEFEKNHSILFKGDVGIGKSHLAYSIAREVKRKGYSVLFIPVPNLMNAIKATYQSNSHESQEDFMSFIGELDLLILDDIGSEYVKVDPNGFESWAADILFQITNIRQNKPTIYTTNYTSAEMEQKYGRQSKRILSRMLSGAEVITFESKDMRVEVMD
ncbi:DNA replication protein DnaC [Salinibacillus kushneri]|uniref:DNA replication protein DnaC n=1 Tax=Salinibacillus kushneri TaxID=237682 RepID=A0A1I0B2C3_9BACI|nr:ATP-binding protein [Salinibacillus kushneri]SET00890.1 DNA replication protein DnaC [Salinibacillus kushneri]